MDSRKEKEGFTIIEVVLVLAIAGLIFLMVFVALPALRRSQRDTARKNDVSIVAAAVTSYSSNNRGDFPTTQTIASYVTELSDNSNAVYVLDSSTVTIKGIDDGVIDIVKGTTCGASTSESQELLAGQSRQFTVTTKLESGSGAYYCQDN